MQMDVTVINGKQLIIKKADITTEISDAIVNPANSNLIHGGGAAKAIVLKGGDQIINQSKSIIRRIGRLPVGKAVITDAGNLPSKFVIHAVGPQMGEGNEEVKLEKTVWNILTIANSYNLRTISIPAISSGIFGFPKNHCARILLKVTLEFLKQPEVSLEKVVMCNHDDETYDIFIRTLESYSFPRHIG